MKMEIFLKSLKWLIAAGLFIIGIVCLVYVRDHHTVKPMIISIFSFGLVFIMYKTNDLNKPLLFSSISILAGAFLLNVFVAIDHPVFTYNFYLAWWLWCAVIGLPGMSFAYKKFKK